MLIMIITLFLEHFISFSSLCSLVYYLDRVTFDIKIFNKNFYFMKWVIMQ